MRHVQRATVIITAIAAALLLFLGGGALRLMMGPISLGGFFAAGELGPIGDRNFLHGFTASVVLFNDA